MEIEHVVRYENRASAPGLGEIRGEAPLLYGDADGDERRDEQLVGFVRGRAIAE